MIWHIFRKDLRLLRVFALMVAAMHVVTAVLRTWIDVTGDSHQMGVIAAWLPVLSIFGMVMLTAVLMHTDAIPGANQDWLVRPVRRIDLLLAKLFFVAIAVQLPLLAVDVVQGLVDGFTLSAALGAAVARNIGVFCCFVLPAIAIGAITRNLTEAVIFGVVVSVVLMVIFEAVVASLFNMRDSLVGTGLSWWMQALWRSAGVAAAVVVLGLQFSRRKTLIARFVFCVAAVILPSWIFIPWPTAFALQEKLSAAHGTAGAITFAFQPRLGSYKAPAGAAAENSATIHLPLRVTGVPADAIVLTDRTLLRIVDAEGRTLYSGKSAAASDGAWSRIDATLEARQGADADVPVDAHQRFFLPASMLAKFGDRPVKLQLDYSLTLFRADAESYSLAAIGGHESHETLGMCATRIDSEGDDVNIHCISTQEQSHCFTAILDDPVSGARNPETHRCTPYYAPFSTLLLPDAYARIDGGVPFFDASGLTRYPVDGTKLAESRLVIKTYSPIEHFTRHLDIPDIRLSDWSRLAAPNASSSGAP